jgi:hypothetical protein
MKKTVLERVTSFVSPSLTDQRAALAARNETSIARQAELRTKCDELAVEGGDAFKAACAEYAAMEGQVAAEANALAKLDQAIAAEKAAEAERARRERHAKAAEIARRQHAEVVALRKKLVDGVNQAAALTYMHDVTCLEHSNRQVSAMAQNANAALFALDEARQSWARGVEKLEAGDNYSDALADRILKYKAPVLKQVE